MNEVLVISCLAVIILCVAILIVLLRQNKNEAFTSQFQLLNAALNEKGDNTQNKIEGLVRSEFVVSREEMQRNSKGVREEVSQTLTQLGESNLNRMQETSQYQKEALDSFANKISSLTNTNTLQFQQLRESTETALQKVKASVENRLEAIQKDNSVKLEKMRETVDEKLHKTLEARLGQSFALVGKQLEAVQRGLGEMQNLATGVGDLKKVLTNVKTRGVMGEIQLGNILEQILSPEQYSLNVATVPGSACNVEFALKFPGKDDSGHPIWLPIDSKFPMDKYEQVLTAYDEACPKMIEKGRKELIRTVKSMAKDISEKYVAPPHTTDFAILFLPIEGLYAELVREPGLAFTLQRDYKIMIAGPTILAALLNALQMGFQTLAIEKRSSEVWKILGSVKTEFGRFGKVLDKVQTKLTQASKTIDEVGVRSRAIERNLRQVDEIPADRQLPFNSKVAALTTEESTEKEYQLF